MAGPVLALVAASVTLVALPGATPPHATAIFAAPSLVIRAAAPGRVQSVAVAAGQAVQPDTALLTIRADQGSAADMVVRARLRGFVRAVQAVAGAQVAAGAPVIELVDCGHAFLVPDDGAPLQAGVRVELRLPGTPPFYGLVRRTSGISEPPSGLVIEPAEGQDPAGACPLGATATVIAER